MAVNIGGLSVVLTVLLVNIEVSCPQKCPSNCISCTSDNNCSSCVNGKHGLVCELSCTTLCSDGSCDKDLGRCLIDCLSHQYLDSGECHGCRQRCSSCTNFSNCSSCKKEHFWGLVCQFDCIGCYYSTCSKENGCSEGCIPKYYQFYSYGKNGFECIRCQENCATCNNETHCLTCEPGYWGSHCQYSCSGCDSYSNCNKALGCIGDCVSGYYRRQMDGGYHCAECPDDNCLICLNATHCQDCIFGYYLKSGQYCDECPSRCSSCTTYDYCTSCRRTWYWGAKCEYDCVGCYENCSRLHGCNAGCDTGYYKTPKPSYEDGFECRPCPEYCTTCMNASKCIACKEGYWGTSCQHNCSGCSGSCSTELGCISDCIAGYFHRRTDNGFQCEECPDTNCLMCVDATECEECKTGFYLAKGRCVGCSENCKHGSCNSENGSCTEGCEDGWSGHSCDQACPANCLHCDKFNKFSCYACAPGFYGKNCDSLCSAYCKSSEESKICQKSNGTCINGCKDGYWGDNCTTNCGKGCLENHCNESTGRCLNGCKDNFYGSYCNKECTCSTKVQDNDDKQTVGTNGEKASNQHNAKNSTVVTALSVVTGVVVLIAAVSITGNIILLKRGGYINKQSNSKCCSKVTQEQDLDNNAYQDLNRREAEDLPYAIVNSEYENAL